MDLQPPSSARLALPGWMCAKGQDAPLSLPPFLQALPSLHHNLHFSLHLFLHLSLFPPSTSPSLLLPPPLPLSSSFPCLSVSLSCRWVLRGTDGFLWSPGEDVSWWCQILRGCVAVSRCTPQTLTHNPLGEIERVRHPLWSECCGLSAPPPPFLLLL